ncbi:MAG: YegS/Rv2252/BmrU family lipid kinase [Chloroflexi bacterium]|nr:YegS/Rv2252/BmrU family lipid kinase [Chloroflexota bacterium]MCL5951664.1 YegS/Rv2252/BmrU family lipid kinase [Chloroflexota bacterium]
MAPNDKSPRKLLKQLKEAQSKHEILLAKVEKTRAKLDKRTRKLQALETKIANLERRTTEPEKKRLGQARAGKDKLRRARLIFNPDSGVGTDNSKRLVEIVGRLREHGILAGIGLKTSGKAARELAKESVEDGDDLIIVAGGDGTIEEVACQLVGSKTTLGIIPTGTMNNLARSLGVPLEIEDACAIIGMGVTRQVDVGHVLSENKPQIEYFLESAGVGLSAIVIPTGHALEKGRWSALPLAMRKLFDTKPAPIEVELDDGQAVHAYSQIVTVSNAPMMGRNIMVAPDAKMDDGYLDVAIYDGMTKTDLLQHFMAAANGTRVEDAKIKYYRTRHVRISANEELDVNSDKDMIPAQRILEKAVARGESAFGSSPSVGPKETSEIVQPGGIKQYVLEIEIVPQALSVIVGKGIALTLPVEAVPSVPPLSGPQSERPDSGNGHNSDLKQAEDAH